MITIIIRLAIFIVLLIIITRKQHKGYRRGGSLWLDGLVECLTRLGLVLAGFITHVCTKRNFARQHTEIIIGNKNNMKHSKIVVAIAAALSATSFNALAEIAPEADADIEKIIVTGQKIDRTIQETPNSVAVITTADIEKQNMQNMADIYSAIPNVAGDFNQGFSIRGINAFNVSGGGNSYLTSVYLDGAPLPYRVVRNGATSVWDLSQVEVFRGPQSTLQGRNALAGAIMLRTQDPTFEWAGKAKATFGEYGQKEFAFAGGGALVDDVLAFRLSYEDKNYDGDIDNSTRNTGSNYEETETVRAKFLFQPSDDFKALLTASKAENEIGPQWTTYDVSGSAFDRLTNYNSHIWERTDTTIYNLEMSWDLNDELSLHSVTTYSDSDYGYNWDGDMQPTQITADSHYTRNDKTLSQELRVVYDTEALQLVSGIYYSKLEVEDAASGERFISFSDVGLPPLEVLLTAPPQFGGFGLPAEYAALILPLYPDIDPIKLGLASSLEQEVSTAAFYADANWSVTDQIDVLLGLRYDTEDQSNASMANYSINNYMPDPAMLPAPLNQIVAGINGNLIGLAASASGTEPVSEADFSAWLPKLGVSFHHSDDVMTSFIYQKGYRSGGVGTNIAQSRLYTYEPEYTDNYELSFRSVFMDGEVVFNTNFFYTSWTDQQVSIQLSAATFDTETINAGESDIKGFETEVFYYPAENLSIVGGIGLAKSEFKTFVSRGTDLAGRSFADAPEWTANLAVNYTFENGVYLNVNTNYGGSSIAYINPQASLDAVKYALNSDPKNDARILVNTQLGYEWDNFEIRLDVRNLFDEEYINAYFSEADSVGDVDSNYGQMQIGRPRQVSMTFQANF